MTLDKKLSKLLIGVPLILSLTLSPILADLPIRLKTKELDVLGDSKIKLFDVGPIQNQYKTLKKVPFSLSGGPSIVYCVIDYTATDTLNVNLLSTDKNSQYLFRIDKGYWYSEPFLGDIDNSLNQHTLGVCGVDVRGCKGHTRNYLFKKQF